MPWNGQTVDEVVATVKNERRTSLDLSRASSSPLWHGEREILTRIPDEVFGLTWLESLTISGHQIAQLPTRIEALSCLRVLDLSDNTLRSIPHEILRLKGLHTLALAGNNIRHLPPWLKTAPISVLTLGGAELQAIPDWLPNLPLKALTIVSNGLIEIPDVVLKLSSLRALDLSLNSLTELPDTFAKSLPNLAVLYLFGNDFKTLPRRIADLREIKELDFGYNHLTDIPNWIGSLVDLERLELRGNKIQSLPNTLGSLASLRHLGLSNNRFDAVPTCIRYIPSLESLDLSNGRLPTSPESAPASWWRKREGDNEIRVIDEWVSDLPNLRALVAHDNPLEKPPLEIVTKGLSAVRAYYEQIRDGGSDFLYEAKLLIVGEGGAGKTTLANKILDRDYALKDEISTKGIDVMSWSFQREGGGTFNANLWDFGGQEIYHSTHQFFLTKRSLYLLVADARKEDTDFFYWLNVVSLLSDASPIVIVHNEKQDRRRVINERELRGEFENLRETASVNLATNRGLDQLLGSIAHYLQRLPHVGSPLPKAWVRVRETLEQSPANYISVEQFYEICDKHGFASLDHKLQLSGYLHDLGVCLHFQQDIVLRKVVILKPRWGTDAVYRVLDDAGVQQNYGKFTRWDLRTIWSEPEYAEVVDELLQLMINFKLCYRVPGKREFYLAPQLLPDNKPSYEWDESDARVVKYSYEFMPKGMLTQFIVAMNEAIDAERVWKSGVVLAFAAAKAEVIEFYNKREIRIRVIGKNKRDALTIAIHEMEKIHAVYPRLRYNQLIPCRCKKCRQDQEPTYFVYDVLTQFLGDKQREIQCQRSYEMVDVRSLIDDAISPPLRDGFATQAVTFGAPVNTVIIGGQERGVAEMHNNGNPWTSGLFYLVAFVAIIALLGGLAGRLSLAQVALVVVGGLVAVTIVGGLQLKQDKRLSDKSFLELMRLSFRQLPIVGQIAGLGHDRSSKEENDRKA